jgi:hypothetical protein
MEQEEEEEEVPGQVVPGCFLWRRVAMTIRYCSTYFLTM